VSRSAEESSSKIQNVDIVRRGGMRSPNEHALVNATEMRRCHFDSSVRRGGRNGGRNFQTEFVRSSSGK